MRPAMPRDAGAEVTKDMVVDVGINSQGGKDLEGSRFAAGEMVWGGGHAAAHARLHFTLRAGGAACTLG